MARDRLLVRAYEFLSNSPVFDQESVLEWCSRLNRLHERGWLYGCFHGEHLKALAGAYRIPQWHESYLETVPDRGEGSILYIPFFVAEGIRMTDPLRLLRRYLNDHPEVGEVLYWEKYRRYGRGLYSVEDRGHARGGRLVRRRVMRRPGGRLDENLSRNRIDIQPPELVSLKFSEEEFFDFESCPAAGLI